jgi:hypothetical protein
MISESREEEHSSRSRSRDREVFLLLLLLSLLLLFPLLPLLSFDLLLESCSLESLQLLLLLPTLPEDRDKLVSGARARAKDRGGRGGDRDPQVVSVRFPVSILSVALALARVVSRAGGAVGWEVD